MLKCLLLVALLSVSACSGKPYAVEHQPETHPLRTNTVYVDSHGWHTGFIMPAGTMNTDLPFLSSRFTGAPYYEFGWGDKGFYQAKAITAGLVLGAMFWSSGTVVHVVAVPEAPASYFDQSEVIPLQLSDSELADLRNYIKGSFAYDAAGNAIPLAHGIYGDSQFYAGSGEYYMFNTCNKWTAKGLKSAGLDISTPFKLTAGSVIGYIKDHNADPTPTTNQPNFRK